MSVTVSTRIGCDLPDGCTTAYEAAGWPGDVRAAAARAGWSSNPDRCPAHPPGVPAAGAPTLFDDDPEAAAMLAPAPPLGGGGVWAPDHIVRGSVQTVFSADAPGRDWPGTA